MRFNLRDLKTVYVWSKQAEDLVFYGKNDNGYNWFYFMYNKKGSNPIIKVYN